MKKIVMIFAAMAAVLSSCQNSELESVSANDGKDIVLNISVSNPGADDTKALIKTGWAANDEISIWYDGNTGAIPDLVVTYNGEKWIKKQDATVSGYNPSTGTGKYAKALYNGTVKVASKDDYTYDNISLTFNIKHWVFLTEVQVVVYGEDINGENPDKYTLSCDKFAPCTGYSVEADGIIATKGTNGAAVIGISNDGANNKAGVAFVFATADYSETTAAYKFTLTDNTSTPAVTKEYTANTGKISGTSGSMEAIKALTIANNNFAVQVNPFVEIEADYDNNPSTPNTTLKWYRQNLAISDSGKKAWKGWIYSAFKVPGTDKDVIVGDYFQWAAHENYSPTEQSQDRGLLLYTSFESYLCDDDTHGFYTNGGPFSKSFNNKDYAPYGGTLYSKYSTTDNKTKLDTSDDVANFILGGNWRMPTITEFQAMREVTYWAWDDHDCGYYVFKPGDGTSGTANGNSNFDPSTDDKSKALLFFPAAGAGFSTNIDMASDHGFYWSSSLETTDYAYYLYFDEDFVFPQGGGSRCYGFSVRPVSE